MPVWEKIISQMATYDLGRLNQDVLKGVYQELVDPEDRHDLGVIVLNSDHERATVLPIDLARPPSAEEALMTAVPLASVG